MTRPVDRWPRVNGPVLMVCLISVLHVQRIIHSSFSFHLKGQVDVVKYPASDKSDRTLTPDPDVLSYKSGRSGKSSKSSRSGIFSVDKSLLDNIADIAG